MEVDNIIKFTTIVARRPSHALPFQPCYKFSC